MAQVTLRFLVSFFLAVAVFACSSPTGSSGSGSANSTVAASVPAAPTNVTATSSTSQVTISWASVSGATSYNVYRALSSGVTKSTGSSFSGLSSPYLQTSLSNGTSYFYVVTAVNSAGESVESSQVSATPLATPTSVLVDFTTRGAETSVQWNLGWGTVTGATGYNVYYSATSGVTTTNGTKLSTATNSMYPLPISHSDYFIVTATNTGGESTPSAEVTGGP